MVNLLPLLLAAAVAGEDFRALDRSAHPAPDAILSSYLQGIAARQLADRRRQVEAIRTKEAYEARKTRLRAAALRMIGGLPDQRTPLNARQTGTLAHVDYRVDKVVYESLPRFYVTANLYVPKGAGPFPAVLQPVGHSLAAKNRAFYQRTAIGLVKQGFVVLTYDPIGQGERRVFWDNDLKDSKVGGPTAEHSMVGWQSLAGGESVARYRIWDGLRSLDYLISRPEVDKDKIGVTGCSGGGTLTTYLAALDDRVKVAAPACYISSWEDQLKGTGPQDAEQQFPDQLREGLNHSDWIGLAAPKPYLIVSTDQDFFPLEGARKTFEEMKRIYRLYDAEVKLDWFHEPGGHGMPQASREAVVNWMKKWLRGDGTAVKEPAFQTEHEEDLNVTETGQVATSLGGETASSWNIARFRGKIPRRPVPVAEEAVRLTRFTHEKTPMNVRRGRTVSREEYRIELLTYEPAAGLTIPAALVTPSPSQPRGMVLLLDPRGKASVLGPDGDAAALVKMGYSVLAIDVSGTGEVAFARSESAPWRAPQLAWLALMVGRPLTGIRVNDVVRGLDMLAELGLLPRAGVTAIARGKLGPVLLHAALFDVRISSVIVEDNLVSYAAVGATPIHRDIEDNIIPGVLGRYDLADVAAALAPRPLWLTNLRSPLGTLLPRRDAVAAYDYAQSAYLAAGKPENLRIGLRREGEPLQAAYPGLN